MWGKLLINVIFDFYIFIFLGLLKYKVIDKKWEYVEKGDEN